MAKHGFYEVKTTELCDIGATAREYRHEVSGTKLLHIDRPDENKSFLIGFKTPPKNDTGVFHIIEHSVLCGSDKYPVKEPFVELLKSSLNTFLNAMTYPDKTVYPVSSMNDKDFYNLVSIYMDAVFFPAFRENENIFRQEAHRLELSEDGTLSRNGVVLNEMKGAYSSAEELEAEVTMQMLFPNSPYAFSSGGDPDHIHELTYEEFLETHKKHYNPTDAYVILDGSVDTDSIFALLDSYFSKCENKSANIEIGEGNAPTGERRMLEYAVSEAEGVKDKTRMTLALRGHRFDKTLENMAMGVIRSAIGAGVTSPFTKAMLDLGLCENVVISPIDGIRENATLITFLNVKDGACDELLSAALAELRKIASGIDKAALRAALSHIEFVTRERNYGTFPVGLVYSLAVLDTWLYSDDATTPLFFEELFASLRERIDTDYYDKLLSSVIPTESEALVLTLAPSTTLERERTEREKNEMAELLSRMSEGERDALRAKKASFDLWQETPDSPEALAKLPTLSVSDISLIPEKTEIAEYEVSGRTVASCEVATSGITYLSAFFDISDLSPEECTDAAIISHCITRLPTAQHTAEELRNLIKTELGYLVAAPTAFMHDDGRYLAYMKLSVGALNTKREKIKEIAGEVLRGTEFVKNDVKTLVTQMRLNLKEGIASDGIGIALDRTHGAMSPDSAATDSFFGFSAYERLTVELSKIESDPEALEALSERLAALMKKIFTQKRLTIALAGGYDEEFVRGFIDAVPDGAGAGAPAPFTLSNLKCEGIEIPARIGFTVEGYPIPKDSITGDMHVVKTILNYEYLWSEIRAKGGAYGAGEVLREGYVGFYSYRDPSPAATLKKYGDVSEFLRKFAKNITDADIEKYILGTFSTVDGVRSAKTKADAEISKWQRGKSYESVLARRREMIAANRDSLKKFADMLSSAKEGRVSSTVASRDMLEKIDGIAEIKTL